MASESQLFLDDEGIEMVLQHTFTESQIQELITCRGEFNGDISELEERMEYLGDMNRYSKSQLQKIYSYLKTRNYYMKKL